MKKYLYIIFSFISYNLFSQEWIQPQIITSFKHGVSIGQIITLKNWGDTAIVVAGSFNNINTIPFDNIAKWNKVSWSSVGNNGTGGGQIVLVYIIMNYILEVV